MSGSSNSWEKLREFTDARIALGRAGGSLKTAELLRFRKDHALAKDAVWTTLDFPLLQHGLEKLNLPYLILSSEAQDRETYIKRPDLGRKLSQESIDTITNSNSPTADISILIADGLSSNAISLHAINFLKEFLPLITQFSLAPICLVSQARVAISDEVGELFSSKLAIILIGERPGLSSPYSMGIYLTYNPKAGNTDEKRNCISNIRAGGLPYAYAAGKLAFLTSEALRLKLSGVDLKDTYDTQLLTNDIGKQ
ncbi:ethanolamine ammonia-lyase subunit EutC [Algoriphagus sp. D3-2-R+10]|uniref:ethanolamine ammonia-lyase subunit EutC n=1 Tax=Algoriphagus aurantiacus TaxID=3103948 RepID=UPI002B3A9A4D|nr:ethanolamine ammonia-lyase subunit EutC [Algoriphagus sp. D3-2-R+10]MEB2773767.1 ethanolamine ammonia-lyase subunit EutC [Algoriphagus sp. D3-2-R+10]